MEFEGRLLVNDFVLREFDHDVDEVVRAVFTREMAASPSADGLLGFEAVGSVMADRLDALGYSADAALDRLDESLELARSAYLGLHDPGEPTMIVSDPVAGLVTLQAEGWLRLFAATARPPSDVHIEWLLGLLEDQDAVTVLRLAALARPGKMLRLEVQPDFDPPAPRLPCQLVITQTAADAEALRFAVQGRTPHLVDLLRISHLGGDESPEALCAQVEGLMRLALLQPLTAVFRPDGFVASLLLQKRPREFRVLVAPEVPRVDPPASLHALLALIGIGAGPRLPRHRPAHGGGASIEPTGATPASD